VSEFRDARTTSLPSPPPTTTSCASSSSISRHETCEQEEENSQCGREGTYEPFLVCESTTTTSEEGQRTNTSTTGPGIRICSIRVLLFIKRVSEEQWMHQSL
jgi:hypothetical protein